MSPLCDNMKTAKKGIEYVKGDLVLMALEGRFDIIAHGCNTMCTMGSGIARTIADTWPNVEQADKQTTPGDLKKLGTIQPVRSENEDLIIVNMYTQPTFGRGLQVDYNAIDLCFSHLTNYTRWFMINNGRLPTVGIPKIGAGLGGGDWNRIEEIILKHDIFNLTCVEFE